MNIFFVAPYIPYPLSEGGKISQYAVIDCLRKLHKVTVLLVSYSIEQDAYIQELNLLWPDVEIVSIKLYNEFDNVKTSKKIAFFILKKIKALAKNIIKFFFKRNLNTLGVTDIDPHFANITYIKNEQLINEVIKIISNREIDIIQVDLIEYADLAFALPKNIKKVFVHHEIRFARILTSLKANNSEFDAYKKYVIAYVKGKEKMLLQLYDAVFVFSEDDKQKLTSEIPDTDIYVAPFPILENNFIEITENNSVINKIVFVGGEEHRPNKDAVEWYIDEIMKLVVSSVNLKLHVIGVWKKETIAKYQANKNIVFEGFVDDLVQFCKNSIMVVPVRIGSGIRTKILYAMAQGVPVVSATIGCEGIGAENNKEILIADDAQSFADAIKKLKTDKDLTLNIINNAQKLVRQKYSQESIGELRSNYFNEIIARKTISSYSNT